MKKTWLISAAAIALIAGGGLASAQGVNERPQAPAAQGAVKGGADMKGGASMKGSSDIKGTTGASSEEKIAPKGAVNDKAAPKAQLKSEDRSKSTTGQAPAKTETKTDTKSSTDVKSGADVKSRSGTVKAGTKSSTETKSSTTTGQGAAGSQGAVNLSTEQRTKITTVIKEKAKVRPATNVNFSISVGTRVPRTVHLYRLPAEVIAIYPAWRGYEFILVGDEIVVINPRTLQIVAVLEA